MSGSESDADASRSVLGPPTQPTNKKSDNLSSEEADSEDCST